MIVASPDGTQAFGTFAPTGKYLNAIIGWANTNKNNCAYLTPTPFPAGSYRYKAYVIVGTLAEVEASINALAAMNLSA